jgi:hypothetical protein
LIVATSNAGFQSAGIAAGRGGAAGGVHAASAVTFFSRSFVGGPCVNVPSIEPLSAARRPSKVPFMPGTTILTVPFCSVAVPGS